MRGAMIERLSEHALHQFHHAGNGIVGQMRISDMALFPVHDDVASERTAPPNFDHIAQAFGIGGLTEDAMVECLAIVFHPFEHFHRTIDGRAFFITCDEKTNRATKIGMPVDEAQRGRNGRRHAALHVGCAAAIHFAVANIARKRRHAPFGFVADGHDISMAGKQKMRSATPKPRIEIVDIGRAIGRKTQQMRFKSGSAQNVSDKAQCAALFRRHRRAPDQRLRQLDGVACVNHQSRRSSLIAVFARVFSSTRFTITAQ